MGEAYPRKLLMRFLSGRERYKSVRSNRGGKATSKSIGGKIPTGSERTIPQLW